MHPSSTEAAVLVLFVSKRPQWWHIELSFHGYEAGAVCGVGEYGVIFLKSPLYSGFLYSKCTRALIFQNLCQVSDGHPESVGLKNTIPPFGRARHARARHARARAVRERERERERESERERERESARERERESER
jgi:hypothetical protein